jgi:hypothetical protein
MNAIGGILILAIGFNMLKIKITKVGNLLPAIFLPILIYFIIGILINDYFLTIYVLFICILLDFQPQSCLHCF